MTFCINGKSYKICSKIESCNAHPIFNVFAEPNVLLAKCTTIVNNQRLVLVHRIGNPCKEDFTTYTHAIELDMGIEIEKYLLMLSLDRHYKLHNKHRLIKGY